jgi:uncharacterized delta-60 repeat protein
MFEECPNFSRAQRAGLTRSVLPHWRLVGLKPFSFLVTLNLSKGLGPDAKHHEWYLRIRHRTQLIARAKSLLGLTLLITTASSIASPGELNSSFGSGGMINICLGPAAADEWANGVAIQPDGGILLGGYVNNSYGLARFESDGTLDGGFGTGGRVLAILGSGGGGPVGMALQQDEKIVIAGSVSFSAFDPYARGFFAVRHDRNGNRDASFGNGGLATVLFNGAGAYASDMVVQPDGKVVVSGYAIQGYEQDFALARFDANGSLDSSFHGNGRVITDLGDRIDRCTSLGLQRDGKIIAAGYSGDMWALVRYNADGTLDNSFHGDGKLRFVVPGYAYPTVSVAVQADGRILLAGSTGASSSSPQFTIYRFNSDGTADETFGLAGKVSTQVGASWSFCSSVVVQHDGKIVTGGWADGGPLFALVRYLNNGALDPAFGTNGVVLTRAGSGGGIILRLALQRDGRILAAGRVWNGINSDFGLVRYEGGVAPWITSQPQSLKVTEGETATFTMVSEGTPPLRYQWLHGVTVLSGDTNSWLTLGNVSFVNRGEYSVVVSNDSGSVTSSIVTLSVNRVPVADTSATVTPVLAPLHGSATIVLDGSRSSDPDNDPLTYTWWLQTNVLATGVVAVVHLSAGHPAIALVVDDGLARSTNVVTLDILTPAEAIARLMSIVASNAPRSHPLLATLHAVLAAANRDEPMAAINQLQAFQNKGRAQVAPDDAALAAKLICLAQDIIDVLGGGPSTASGTAKIHSAVRNADGRFTVQFSGRSRQVFLVEASTNLVHWEAIGVARQTSNGEFEFDDASAPRFSNRFYRIVSP